MRVDHKSGTKNPGTEQERPWAFDIIRVLVAEMDIVEVQKFADNATPVPTVGTEVDYAVTVDTYRGKVSAQLDQPWSQLVPAVLVPVPADGFDYATA